MARKKIPEIRHCETYVLRHILEPYRIRRAVWQITKKTSTAEFSSTLYLHGQIIDTKEKEHCTTIYHNCDIQLVYKLATSVASMSRVTTIQKGLHSAIMPYSSTSSTLPRLPASLCCALILPSALLSSPTSTHKIRWSIYLSKFVILPAESISDHCLFAYLKILKLTIVG